MSLKRGSELQGKGHNLVVKQTRSMIPVLQLLATRIASSPNTCLLNWKSRSPYVSLQGGCEESVENRWHIPTQCLPCIRSWANTGGFPHKLSTPKICDTTALRKARNRTGFPKAPQKNHKTPRKKEKTFVKLGHAHKCLIGRGNKAIDLGRLSIFL